MFSRSPASFRQRSFLRFAATLSLLALLAGVANRAWATPAGPLAITNASGTLAGGQIGVAYSQFVTISGGMGPFTWFVADGLPNGVFLNPGTGEISGTPAGLPGTNTFTVEVQDAAGGRATKSFTIRVVAAVGMTRGKFADRTSAYFPTTTDDSFAIVLADLNGNGTKDVVVINSSGQQDKFYNNSGLPPPATVFSDVTAANAPVEALSGRAAEHLGVSGDPLVIANFGAQNAFWVPNALAPGAYLDGTSALPTDADPSQAVLSEDLNGDGAYEIVFGNNGQSKLYLNIGTSFSNKFVDITATDFPNLSADTRFLSEEDVDGDTDLDLLLANSSGGHDRLYLNQLSDAANRGFSVAGRVFTPDSLYKIASDSLALTEPNTSVMSMDVVMNKDTRDALILLVVDKDVAANGLGGVDDQYQVLASFFDARRRKMTPPVVLVGGDPAKQPANPIGTFYLANPGPSANDGDAVIVWSREVNSTNTSDAVFYTRFQRSAYDAAPGTSPFGFTLTATQLTQPFPPDSASTNIDDVRSYAFVADTIDEPAETEGDADANPPTFNPGKHGEGAGFYGRYLGLVIVQDDDNGASGLLTTKMRGSVYDVTTGLFGAPTTIAAPESTLATSNDATCVDFGGNPNLLYVTYGPGVFFHFEDGVSGAADPDIGLAWAGSASGTTLTFPATAVLLNSLASFRDNDASGDIQTAHLFRGPIGYGQGFNNTAIALTYNPSHLAGNDTKVFLVTLNDTTGAIVSGPTQISSLVVTGDAHYQQIGSGHADDQAVVDSGVNYACFLWDEEDNRTLSNDTFGDNDSGTYLCEFTNSALGVAPNIQGTTRVDHNPSGSANGDIDMVSEAGFAGVSDGARLNGNTQPDNFIGIFYEWHDTGGPANSDRQLWATRYSPFTTGGGGAVSPQVNMGVTAYGDAGLTDCSELPSMMADGSGKFVVVFSQQDGTADFRLYASRYDGSTATPVEIGAGVGVGNSVDAFEHMQDNSVSVSDSPAPAQFLHILFLEEHSVGDTTMAWRHRRYTRGSATFNLAAFSATTDLDDGAGVAVGGQPDAIEDWNENLVTIFKQNGLYHVRRYLAGSNTWQASTHLPAAGSGGDTELTMGMSEKAEALFVAAQATGIYYRAIPKLFYLPMYIDATSTNLPAFDNVVASANESGTAGGFGDVDGDGDVDLFIANEDTDGAGPMTGQDQLYLNNGSGVFTSATAANLPVETAAAKTAQDIDFDGDGDIDFVIGFSGSQIKLLRNDGAGVFTDATASFLPAVTPDARDLDHHDFDNDGDADIMVAANGQERVLVNLNPGALVTSVGGGNPGPTSPATNASNVLVMAFRLTAGSAATEDVTVSSIAFSSAGTGNESTAITAVALFKDTNANSAFDPGADTQVGTAQVYGADNGAITFAALSLTVPAGGFQDMFLVYNLGGAGTAGQTFAATLDPTPGIGAAGASYGGVISSGGTLFSSSALTLSNALADTSTSPLPQGSPGAGYSFTFTHGGGSGPFTWSVFSGSLPAGLSLSSGGVLSGTPTTSGISSFNVRVTDSLSATDTDAFSLTIANDLTLTTATYPDLTANAVNSRTIAATGGNGAYTFSISAGSLPAGMTLTTSTGVINGTPTAAGAFSFTIRVTDAGTAASAADTATQAYSGTVQPSFITTTFSTTTNGVVGTAYSLNFLRIDAGGNPPYTWSVSSGSLPAGTSLTPTGNLGVLSGAPTASGAFTFVATMSDSTVGGAATTTSGVNGTITADLAIITTSLPSVALGAGYNTFVLASGGNAPLAFSIASGSLPTGIAFSPGTNMLTGTASGLAGTYTFTVLATDSSAVPPNAAADTDTQALSIQVVGTLNITTTSLPDGIVGASYSQTMATTGGATPFTWTVTAGSLPAGLSLNSSTGAITGTPTATGSSSFTVRVTDCTVQPAPQTDTQALTLDVTLAVPTGLSGVAGDGSVALSWGTVSGAAGYKVYYGDTTGIYSGTAANEGSSPIDVPGGGSNSLTLTGLTNGSTHFLAVTSYDAGMVESAYSKELPSVPQSSTSFTQTKQAPGGVTVAAFRMISFPVTPASGGLGEFEDDLGPYDPHTWRMFAWDASGQAYVEANSASAPSIQPGRGFWLIAKTDTLIDLNGTLPNTGGPFEITLAPGWNLIGSPFSFQVLWDDCAVNGTEIPSQSLVGQELWDWDGTTYTDVPQLVNGRGYWVRNLTDSSVTLGIPPIVAGPGAKPLVPSGGDYSHASTGAPPAPPGAVVVVASAGSSGGSSSAASTANPAVSSGDGGGAGVSPASGAGGGGGGGCFATRLVGQPSVCPLGLLAVAFLAIGLALWFAMERAFRL